MVLLKVQFNTKLYQYLYSMLLPFGTILREYWQSALRKRGFRGEICRYCASVMPIRLID